MKNIFSVLAVCILLISGCKKKGCTDSVATNYNSKAKKNDGSCTYASSYFVPTTYQFTDASGISTIDFTGQSNRLNQLREMISYIEGNMVGGLNRTQLQDMFENTNGNANGAFSFVSTQQLRNKVFALDVITLEHFLDSLSLISQSAGIEAENGQAGKLSSGSSNYYFSKNGIEYSELFEKISMGSIFMYQCLNVYFGAEKMDVDNSTIVAGKNYTTMQHHWDEAFGYVGLDAAFPSVLPIDMWGKYINNQNSILGSNDVIMSNFLKGRAAINASVLTDRDLAIFQIRKMWEKVVAYQAMAYLQTAIDNFGTDDAKYLHNLSEAFAFVYCLRYAPTETRVISVGTAENLVNSFGNNFWNLSLVNLNSIRTSIDNLY